VQLFLLYAWGSFMGKVSVSEVVKQQLIIHIEDTL
jgi:hypothetical protein